MRKVTALAVVAAVLLVSAVGSAAPTAPTTELTARLTPAEVAGTPVNVRVGARGTFRATFWPQNHGSWESAHFWLSTRRLTGPALTAHIHTGGPGRNGPVLITVCTDGRCSLQGSGYHAYAGGMLVRTMRLLGAYVDVHTAKNPRGELRGQIVIGP